MNASKTSTTRPGIGQILMPYWQTPEKYLALFILAVIISINLGTAYISVEANRVSGKFTDALIGLDWEQIKPLFIFSFILGLSAMMLRWVNVLSQGYLALRWRTWMTLHYIRRWTGTSAYYEIERDGALSNIDQRIADDVNELVSASLNFFLSLISVVISTVTYTALLWSVSGVLRFSFMGSDWAISGYMVYALYIEYILQVALSHWLGKTLIKLNMNQQNAEGDFRFLGVQLRENAEQIAFYQGGAREGERLAQRFARVRDNALSVLLRGFKVSFGQSLFSHFLSPLPTLLALPQLLRGEITFGDLTRIQMAYGSLGATLSYFMQAYQAFTRWLALAKRLQDMEAALNKSVRTSSPIRVTEHDGLGFSCENLRLLTPDGRALTALNDWQVLPCERWMINGASGVGKSTLLRACAGLWQHGSGAISRPRHCRTLFLPQKSYLPTGTLKAALCYPSNVRDFTDEQCRQALIGSELSDMASQLNDEDRWQQRLSGGEQQRMAIARALLHRPDFIFLDEATSALDPETEQQVYQALVTALPDSAIISVAHRESLAALHTHHLHLVPLAESDGLHKKDAYAGDDAPPNPDSDRAFSERGFT
ncbi:ABC transporter ATP-binding protein/permease [Pectobacterium atrosepticum]|uniref:ABC transporter ATP-binding protein/permease n=1 Tax=Pectobacterium atrosepticum TaxID=29471 RepID=UPI000C289509|nr:ABC transporter ATP-binding protein/permease [Pectobacterium atrosepticum]GKV86453.1 ABC transporter [Pectobacterium carotovorum subsp. carotovorum]ATY90058.1 ABC transporter ATP-binding protein [Pectobacterium atrosepticum]MBL0893844.1 ABC transporter ATP-binding protein/permease [Pectobacterium atrosepticum]MCA6976804.1 ABC transporter ATP-binding protein/permease [Pectobacterium atrosepticum]MCH5018006.1 ABC transporter ATP-binding protein/permease [Pectobacterium atrosepticum]